MNSGRLQNTKLMYRNLYIKNKLPESKIIEIIPIIITPKVCLEIYLPKEVKKSVLGKL